MINITDTLDSVKDKIDKNIDDIMPVSMGYKFSDYANAVELSENLKIIGSELEIENISDLIFITKNLQLYLTECNRCTRLNIYGIDIKKISYYIFKYMADKTRIIPKTLFGGITLNPNWDAIYGKPVFLGVRVGHNAYEDYLNLISHFSTDELRIDRSSSISRLLLLHVGRSIYGFYTLLDINTIGDLLSASQDRATFYRFVAKADNMNIIPMSYDEKSIAQIWLITNTIKKLLTNR